MQRITHIRYSFLDLPKAITTSVFAFYNTSIITYASGELLFTNKTSFVNIAIIFASLT